MKQSRAIIPKATKEGLLHEYNHRCAICGADRPQIHHIDENPANNEPLNLLPLCPNHHLSDQHNPTTRIDPQRLALFRKHKDPQILAAQFAPIFKRIYFLLSPLENQSYDQLANSAVDLIRFSENLQMGGYYGKVLRDLLDWSYQAGYTEETKMIFFRERQEEYHKRLQRNAQRAIELIVEQLRYQAWGAYGENS